MARGSTNNHRLAVICMGASAGGVDALSAAVTGLPADLRAAVLIVLHVSPRGKSVLPQILDKRCQLPVAHAVDGEPLQAGRVYVAPPDRHLVVEDGVVRLSDGPRENGLRPSVDTLFRSAALSYGPDVIGVVLSGTLDDGTAGIIAIKQGGGVSVVQDPAEAVFPGMPRSAARFGDPDHIVPLDKLAPLLVNLVQDDTEEPISTEGSAMPEIRNTDQRSADAQAGEPSEFTCPECGGTLWAQEEGPLLRFRCRVGHAYSTQSLLAEQTQSLEAALWAAVVALEERADLALRLARRMEGRGRANAAHRFELEVSDARRRAGLVREAIVHLSAPIDGEEELEADA